ncbi:KGK domain-containing protein [Anabaena sp. UHCC 0451]|uniref:KGK domain-containing protein n=1 Tax=Anabaena sp. UHCC 0451 TaxID=2055235 RepID=UPI002B1F46E2|nr:KGK domain-containing protein [Anabaena sp. UHCC 0451]MEA5579431.1 KGK domain-containing protein [Anabaena sp. UHCC 0451]
MKGFNLDNNDVVKLDSSENPAETTTSTHSEVIQAIWAGVRYRLKEGKRINDLSSFNRIFSHGVRGQVLRPHGGGWQSGVVRVCLEFVPDEPEEDELQEVVLLPPSKEKSPLDDLRAELLNNE